MKYAFLLPVLLAGCTENNASVDIDRYLAITTMGMCQADPASTINRSAGLLDVGLVAATSASGVQGYVAAPVVRNNMPLRATANTIDLDAVTVEGFDVQLQMPTSLAGAVSQTSFFLQTGGQRIDGGGGNTAAVSVELIPSMLARQLAAAVPVGTTTLPEVVASLRPVVKRVDGSTFSGGWSEFPITLCNFCLTGGAPQACPAGGFLSTTVKPGGCFVQQDDSETCCVQNNQLLCGAQVPQH